MRYAIAIMSVAVSAALSASVPLRWTVETSRAQVAQFEAYRGETLALEAALNSYGKPLEGVLQPTLYWQTNGMGAAWWTAPATADGNVLRATWSPTNDCGATYYNCFLGGPDATYRAAFRLRMLPSPGFAPNHPRIPSVTYDAALFGEPTINGTNLIEIVRRMNESETMTAKETNAQVRLFHGDTFPTMRVEPPKSAETLPVNQWRALELGDDKTISKTRCHETEMMLVDSPSRLYFVDRATVDGSATNYVLKSLQQYLDAVSPDAVGDLLGMYLPTNGGGTVHGELNVHGDLFVDGEVSMPRLVNVRSANIFADGFNVSNGVLRANSGLVVSNGHCIIRAADTVAGGYVAADRFHVNDGGTITIGGTLDHPTTTLAREVETITDMRLDRLGFQLSGMGTIGSTEGLWGYGTHDAFARMSDLVVHARINCARPLSDEPFSGGSRASVRLRNWCVNVLDGCLSATREVKIYYPYHSIKDGLDGTQRLAFGVYISRGTSAEFAWDCSHEDGGFALVGETGDELSSISYGDLIWFQQVGADVLSVSKRRFSIPITPKFAE